MKKKPKQDHQAPPVGVPRLVLPCAWDRLTISAVAIIHLHEMGRLSEGQAVKLMNCGDRVSYRLLREKLEKEMASILEKDMAANGWQNAAGLAPMPGLDIESTLDNQTK